MSRIRYFTYVSEIEQVLDDVGHGVLEPWRADVVDAVAVWAEEKFGPFAGIDKVEGESWVFGGVDWGSPRTWADYRLNYLLEIQKEGLSYVGWGGKHRVLRGQLVDLGFAVRTRDHPRDRHSHWGRWLFHFANGRINGFPISACLYFVLTRCMGRTVWHYAYHHEGQFHERSGRPCRPGCRSCMRDGVAA